MIIKSQLTRRQEKINVQTLKNNQNKQAKKIFDKVLQNEPFLREEYGGATQQRIESVSSRWKRWNLKKKNRRKSNLVFM